jgi:hypothetical protein
MPTNSRTCDDPLEANEALYRTHTTASLLQLRFELVTELAYRQAHDDEDADDPLESLLDAYQRLTGKPLPRALRPPAGWKPEMPDRQRQFFQNRITCIDRILKERRP